MYEAGQLTTKFEMKMSKGKALGISLFDFLALPIFLFSHARSNWLIRYIWEVLHPNGQV